MILRIISKFSLCLTILFLYGLTTVFSNAFAFCSGGFGDPNYEACRQQEESNHIQQQILETQRQQMEQQRQDNMMRNSEGSLGHRRWN